jgi:hypothetical protein
VQRPPPVLGRWAADRSTVDDKSHVFDCDSVVVKGEEFKVQLEEARQEWRWQHPRVQCRLCEPKA